MNKNVSQYIFISMKIILVINKVFIISNISLEKNEKEMALAQLNFLYEYNNYIKKQFTIEPNFILVGNMRFSLDELQGSSLFPDFFNINLRFSEPENSNNRNFRNHHDYIICSKKMDLPTFDDPYPNFGDKQINYPDYTKEFIIFDSDKKNGLLNNKVNWPSDHDGIFINVKLFDSFSEEQSRTTHLSDINEKTNHLFDSLFEDSAPSNHKSTSNLPISSDYFRERESNPPVYLGEQYKNQDLQKSLESQLESQKKKNYEIAKIALKDSFSESSKKKDEYSGSKINEYQESMSLHDPNFNQQSNSFQYPDSMNVVNQNYNQSSDISKYQDLLSPSNPVQEPVRENMTMSTLNSPVYTEESKYEIPNELNSFPTDIMSNNNYSEKETRSLYGENNQDLSSRFADELNNEFKELNPPEIDPINREEYLHILQESDIDKNRYMFNQHGGNQIINSQEVDNTIQLLIDNIHKVDELKKDIDSMYKYTKSPKSKNKKGGLTRKRNYKKRKTSRKKNLI